MERGSSLNKANRCEDEDKNGLGQHIEGWDGINLGISEDEKEDDEMGNRPNKEVKLG